MSSSPQYPVVDPPEAPTSAYSTPSPAPVSQARPRRTFSARVTAAIGAGALVVGAVLGAVTGGLVGGPGGPGGGPGGAPPGASTQDGTAGQGTAPGGDATDGAATQGTTSGT